MKQKRDLEEVIYIIVALLSQIMRIRAGLDTQKQMAKANACPKDELSNTKSVKTGRIKEGQAVTKCIFIVWLWVLCICLSCYPCWLTHRNGDKACVSMAKNVWWGFRGMAVPGIRRYQHFWIISVHKKGELWPRSTYKLLCFKEKFSLNLLWALNCSKWKTGI